MHQQLLMNVATRSSATASKKHSLSHLPNHAHIHTHRTPKTHFSQSTFITFITTICASSTLHLSTLSSSSGKGKVRSLKYDKDENPKSQQPLPRDQRLCSPLSTCIKNNPNKQQPHQPCTNASAAARIRPSIPFSPRIIGPCPITRPSHFPPPPPHKENKARTT